jgi:predicted O-methyltransferase YrrM
MLSMATTRRRSRNLALHWLVPPPVRTDHWEYSGVSFIEPGEEAPKELVLLALRAAERALSVDLSELSQRIPTGLRYPDLWPGQHYKLLAALTSILQPLQAIEIGTHAGLSALAIQRALPPQGKLSTFDIVPWKQIPDAVLRPEDFSSGQLEQIVADLSCKETAWEHAHLLRNADFIFIDAAKDGVMEWRLLEHFHEIGLKKGAILFFDDIRLWNMLAVWKSIRYPKLDVTSFGHYTGSGIVRIDS